MTLYGKELFASTELQSLLELLNGTKANNRIAILSLEEQKPLLFTQSLFLI